VEAGHPVEGAADDLRASVIDNADHGLSVWYFQRDGTENHPFKDLQEAYEAVRLEIRDAL
jgi:hypothetical protein